MLAIFSSCENEDHSHDTNNYTGDEQTYFTEQSLIKDVALAPTTDPNVTITVGSTVTSGSDRTYAIGIDNTSTAVQDVEFMLPSSTVTIPAGEHLGHYTFEALFDGIQDDGSSLVLNLVQINDYVSTFSNQITINLSKECDDTFVSSITPGMYSVTTTYGYHDFLPDYNPNTTTAEIFSEGGNFFSVADFSGGLYSVGPYAGAYGTGAADNSILFEDECNKLTWEGQTDPWGDLLPLDGGVNKVDPATGVITMSWFCTGYGENGVSVYTPL